ncbi:MAG: 2-oxo acid dehydrogenase subunit E2 [Candidatus Binatia bacterium]
MDIKLPRLGEGADSATVVNILVSEGDEIAVDQTILELENEKAIAPIPSTLSGKVTRIYVKEGDAITVGQALISVAPKNTNDDIAEKPEDRVDPTEETTDGEESAVPQQETKSPSGLGPPASPSIRKTARELGIDLTRVKGSERGGRIVLRDLKSYIEHLQQLASQRIVPTRELQSPSTAEGIDFSKWGPVRREPITSLRRTVGKRMVESWATIPHITQFDEADITSVLAMRKRQAPLYKKKRVHLTLTSFVLKAVIQALKKHPVFNSSLDDVTGEIVYKDYYHVCIAVDTEAGLIVPVIKDVDKKDMLKLSKELSELTEKTRRRKVSLEELLGGSFTISNQGTIGSTYFTPIIYKPQVAVLGLGRGMSKVVSINQQTAVRTMLPLSLSYDHRVIDGANAVRFIREIVYALEHFNEAELTG